MSLIVQYCFAVYKRALLSGIIIAILNAWHLLQIEQQSIPVSYPLLTPNRGGGSFFEAKLR